MTTSTPEKSIEMLVDQAHRYAQSSTETGAGKSSWASSRLVWMTGAVAVALWGYHLTRAPSKEAIYADLEHLVLQASSSVDGAFKATNALPDHLDDPHLAAVVQYLPQWYDPKSGRNQYSLIARTGRYALVWNSNEPQRFERKE